MTQQPLFPATTPPATRSRKTYWTDSLPAWLATTIDSLQPSPTTDKAILAQCGRCAAYTLNGWDGPLQAKVDPRRLSSQEELAAIVTGRTTFTLDARHGDGIWLTERDRYNTTGKPATTSSLPVVAEHRCHRTLGTPIPWENLYPQPIEGATNAPPPF